MLNILIADDHELVRRGLKELLREEYPDATLEEAENGEAAVSMLGKRKWDLILLDIVMPGLNIIDLLSSIRQRDAHVPILILTAVSETEYAVSTLKAGANGYITKQHASDELILAVRTVLGGQSYLSREAANALTARLRGTTAKAEAPHEALSEREFEIFCMLARGKSVKEVAFDLSLSAKTVATYIARIKEKTGLETYVEIARYALQHKLVD